MEWHLPPTQGKWEQGLLSTKIAELCLLGLENTSHSETENLLLFPILTTPPLQQSVLPPWKSTSTSMPTFNLVYIKPMEIGISRKLIL